VAAHGTRRALQQALKLLPLGKFLGGRGGMDSWLNTPRSFSRTR
jgi:hypothetical protein